MAIPPRGGLRAAFTEFTIIFTCPCSSSSPDTFPVDPRESSASQCCGVKEEQVGFTAREKGAEMLRAQCRLDIMGSASSSISTLSMVGHSTSPPRQRQGPMCKQSAWGWVGQRMRLCTQQASTPGARLPSALLGSTRGTLRSVATHNFRVLPRNPAGEPSSRPLHGRGLVPGPASQACCPPMRAASERPPSPGCCCVRREGQAGGGETSSGAGDIYQIN